MSKNNEMITVALVDDQAALRESLATVIANTQGYKVLFTANDGEEALGKIKEGLVPDVLVLDYAMPGMNGYDTAIWLRTNTPEVRILILTMYDTDIILIRLLHAGVQGFLKKDAYPLEILCAIKEMKQVGYFYNSINRRLVNIFREGPENPVIKQSSLTNTELEFLKLVCTDQGYKEIAAGMNLNIAQVEKMCESLYKRMDVKSRVGLALFAVRNGLVEFVS